MPPAPAQKKVQGWILFFDDHGNNDDDDDDAVEKEMDQLGFKSNSKEIQITFISKSSFCC